MVSSDSVVGGEYGTPMQLSLEVYKTWEKVKGLSTDARRVRQRKLANKRSKESRHQDGRFMNGD